jgi:adenylate kinase
LKQKDVIIFVGPPGAGKGSISQLCIQNSDWIHLSTGNLCRKHISEQTPIGKEIDFAIKSGKLVSDKLIVDMVADWFEKQQELLDKVILDGTPRTVPQAQALTNLAERSLQGVRFWVIRLMIPNEIAVERLSSRYTCQDNNCQAVYSCVPGSLLKSKSGMACDKCAAPLVRRKDDEPSAVSERLNIYYKHEQALLDFYESTGQYIHELNVNEPLEVVFNEFKRIIGV